MKPNQTTGQHLHAAAAAAAAIVVVVASRDRQRQTETKRLKGDKRRQQATVYSLPYALQCRADILQFAAVSEAAAAAALSLHLR